MRKIKRHWIIAPLILLLPLSIGLFFYLPQYYSFTAMGEIVPIREIGVDGSVHFVFVREGITRNRYEKLTISRSLPDAHFTRVDSSVEETFTDMQEIGEELRNETIRHAVDNMAEETGVSVAQQALEERLEMLIEETAEYYGDSIGLMLGVGLMEEVRKEDFSHGGKITIAGTGTLEEDGSVGSVGAIRDKLRTAESQGADIFLVPRDQESFMYEGLSNEEEAQLVARELHLRLRVVPVSSLEEAITFLRQLS